jgi:hypothetical protein
MISSSHFYAFISFWAEIANTTAIQVELHDDAYDTAVVNIALHLSWFQFLNLPAKGRQTRGARWNREAYQVWS